MTVLFKRHFQVAYLADNVDAAIALFADNYGIGKWNVMDMLDIHGQGAAARYIATAWAGDVQIEIIQPIETVPSLYSNWRRDGGLPLRLHHLGFLIVPRRNWRRPRRRWRPRVRSSSPKALLGKSWTSPTPTRQRNSVIIMNLFACAAGESNFWMRRL